MDIICRKCHVPTDETDIHWTYSENKGTTWCYECVSKHVFGKVMIDDIPVEETI